MPGRILVFDPIVTNRIMLKAQLSADFFDVALASDLSELQKSARLFKPDLVIISYDAAQSDNFESIHWLRNNPTTSYTPLVFLHSSDQAQVWDQSHDVMVDDVLCYSCEKWLMAARLNLLIRGKERIDALCARQSTLSEMGFAEDTLNFPPLCQDRFVLDFTNATTTFDTAFRNTLTSLLAKEFPALRIRTSVAQKRCARAANLVIIDPRTIGSDRSFAKMTSRRRTPETSDEAYLYTAASECAQTATRAVELGASDFTFGIPSPTELACRIRRILWHQIVSKQAEKSVSNLLQSALTDPLTELYNRRYALRYLNQLVQANQSSVTVMVVDLDRFKSINDTYGHLTGDSVIRQSAQRLKRNLRSADLVARIGGEEFLVILKDASVKRVRDIAERLRSEISLRSFLAEDGSAISVSASIGVSASKEKWSSPQELIDSADRALYKSKNLGRDRVTFCDKAA